MNEIAVLFYTKWLMLKGWAADGIRDFLTDEQGDVNIVSIVVLIGIAVVLAVLFRSQIEGLLQTLFDSIEDNAEKAVSGGGD